MALTKIWVDRQPIEDKVLDTADMLGGQFGLLDNLKGLKSGDQNPSSQVVGALKNLLGAKVPPDELDRILVKPFEKPE